MKKTTLKVLLLCIGIIAMILAAVICSTDVGSYERNNSYGGDAYTGIQNAAAQAANNTLAVGEMVQIGFASLLVIHGLVLIAFGICIQPSKDAVIPAVSESNKAEEY